MVDKYVELEVLVKHQTDKAVLVEVDGEEVWIPWSQVEDNGEEFKNGYEGIMYVTRWFADKEELTYVDEE